MRRIARALLAAWLVAWLAPASAGETGPYVFPLPRDARAVERGCTALLADLAAQARRVARGDGEVLEGMDRLARMVDDGLGPLGLLANVHPDKPLRDAAEACQLRYQAWASSLYQDRAIHARLVALQPADAVDAALRTELVENFEDAGVALPPAQRAEARRLTQSIGRLQQDFERRVREDRSRVAFTDAELEGVPEAVRRAAPRDAAGRRLIGLDYPSYDPVIETARRPATRERLWRAFQSRGGRANLETLARLTRERRDYARLFGHASYADFALRRRMAGDVAAVRGFLDAVREAVAPREARDLDELRAARAAELGDAASAGPLKRWDLAYYSERIRRERYALDQERFRRHFPPQASVDFVMALAGRLFGLRFEPLRQPLWHPQASAYAVVDADGGALLATLYLDLYPRADKYGHAAVWGLRGGARAAGRLPAAALVTNIDRHGLTLLELETLLHEFGHALHAALSTTRYASQSGLNVKLDFVEAPAQMLEEWVYDTRALALFAEVCPACEPVPEVLLAQALRSRGFAKGLQFARQHLYASYDLALHDADAPDPMAAWARLEGTTPLGHEPGSMFPAGFTHLAGGYGAGYYAYLWSLATAQDLYTAFAADPLDAATGRRFRREVLAPGGEVAATALVTRFLGRPPSNAAFFDWLER